MTQNSSRTEKEKEKKVVETTKFEMSKMDIIWCVIGLAVIGFSFYMFFKVNAVHAVQRNVKRYKLKNFKKSDGTPPSSYEEL